MTTPIAATLPPGYATPTLGTPGAAATPAGGLNGVNAQTFLQLLVAQLQYQDPSNPTDPTQFLSQTAQFQEVEQLQTLQTSLTAMQSSLAAASASGMLGQQVTATGADGTSQISGVVTSVNLSSAGPVLTVGGTQVPLSSVTSVAKPTA